MLVTYLEPLASTTFIIGEPSILDLFNIRGILMLSKGKPITLNIQELLQRRQIYILKYNMNKPESQTPISTQKVSASEYQYVVGYVREVFEDTRIISVDWLPKAFSVVDRIINELEGISKTYIDLNEFRKFDNYTYIHSINVAILATLIGLQMGFKEQILRNLTLGALFHDIGKSAIPSEVLNKPSSLTYSELEVIKQHPVLGEEMIRKTDTTGEVLSIIRHHHERWNGKGYPDGLRQTAITLNAQIVAVADVFDALVGDRPYREGLPPYHALEIIIAGSGQEFNEKVVEAFVQCLVLYQQGSIVTLNTGEVGTVIGVPKNFPSRPLLKLLFDTQGNYIHDHQICDLSQHLTKFVKSVDFRSVP